MTTTRLAPLLLIGLLTPVLGACASEAPRPLLLARAELPVPPPPANLFGPTNGKADPPLQIDMVMVMASREREAAARRTAAEPALEVARAEEPTAAAPRFETTTVMPPPLAMARLAPIDPVAPPITKPVMSASVALAAAPVRVRPAALAQIAPRTRGSQAASARRSPRSSLIASAPRLVTVSAPSPSRAMRPASTALAPHRLSNAPADVRAPAPRTAFLQRVREIIFAWLPLRQV